MSGKPNVKKALRVPTKGEVVGGCSGSIIAFAANLYLDGNTKTLVISLAPWATVVSASILAALSVVSTAFIARTFVIYSAARAKKQARTALADPNASPAVKSAAQNHIDNVHMRLMDYTKDNLNRAIDIAKVTPPYVNNLKKPPRP